MVSNVYIFFMMNTSYSSILSISHANYSNYAYKVKSWIFTRYVCFDQLISVARNNELMYFLMTNPMFFFSTTIIQSLRAK